MKTITNLEELNRAIEELEIEQKVDWLLLKEQVNETYTNLKPINLIKNSLKEIVTSSDFQSNAINTAIGITSGYVAKKVLVGETHNPLSKIVGNIIELVVANKAFNNAEGIKSIGSFILKKLLNKNTSDEEGEGEGEGEETREETREKEA